MMKRNTKVFFSLGLILSLFLLASPSFAASACKGLSKAKCGSSCTWVDSYTTKTGNKVNGYCRTKPGSSAKKDMSKAKEKASDKAKAAKNKAKDKAKAAKAKAKEKTSK